MTVLITQTSETFAGDDVVTAFTIPFPFQREADLVVEKTLGDGSTTQLVLNVDYTVTGEGSDGGGTVTLSGAPLASDETLRVERVVPYGQDTSFVDQGAFYPRVHERAMDRLAMQIQQLAAGVAAGGGGGGSGTSGYPPVFTTGTRPVAGPQWSFIVVKDPAQSARLQFPLMKADDLTYAWADVAVAPF